MLFIQLSFQFGAEPQQKGDIYCAGCTTVHAHSHEHGQCSLHMHGAGSKWYRSASVIFAVKYFHVRDTIEEGISRNPCILACLV